jgi:hypothetical protein
MLLSVSLLCVDAFAEGRWVKEGATQEEMTQDHYACLRESQRKAKAQSPEARAYQTGQLGSHAARRTAAQQQAQDPQGGGASEVDLYRACASARGYVWVNS